MLETRPVAATPALATPPNSLARLPNELLDRIFAHLRPDDCSGGPELCTLALTRLLNDSAEEALYRHVKIQGSSIVLQVAVKLIRKPNLGSKVHSLSLETLVDPNGANSNLANAEGANWDHWVTLVLLRTPNVEQLHLEMIYRIQYSVWHAISLPKLEVLALKAKSSHRIRTLYSAPALRTLRLDGVLHGDPVLDPFHVAHNITELDCSNIRFEQLEHSVDLDSSGMFSIASLVYELAAATSLAVRRATAYT